jgi:carboxyl-terminal processing protease
VQDGFYDASMKGQNWSRWKNRYDRKLKDSEDAYKAIETMLASLGDPYTRLLRPIDFEEEKSQIAARLFGVGMQLALSKDKKVTVVAPITDTPAFKAGIMSGDVVLEVDGEDIQALSLDQVVRKIRGPVGTKVTIKFLRRGERIQVPLVRAEIPIRTIANETILPGNLGYIRMDSFIHHNGAEDMKQAFLRMANTEGIILDLRNNPGGLLANGIDTAGFLLNHGTVVVSTDMRGAIDHQKSKVDRICTLPVVVLINKGSASASEIVSGALRDHGRAKLVGESTFGKGLVQSINKLPDGSGVNMTIARYLTPSNRPVDKVGIEPDYKVVPRDLEGDEGDGPWWFDRSFQRTRSPLDGKDIQLRKAIWVLRNQIAFGKGLPPIAEPDPVIAAAAPIVPVILGARPGGGTSSGGGGSSSTSSSTSTSGPGGGNTSSTTSTLTSTSAAAASKNRPVKDKWALLVGISRFQKPTLNLKYPAKDAQDFANFLTGQCHFAPDHVRVLTDNQATRGAIMSELGDKWLPRVVKPDDLVVLYFSTHGSPSDLDVGDVNYLVAWDTDPDSLFASGVPMQDLVRIIKSRIRSDRVVVVLDACYSGNVDVKAKGLHRSGNVDPEAVSLGTGQLVISSSAPNQISWESNLQPNSVFTRHLMSSLRINGDKTKLGDAFKILRDRVEDEVQRQRGKIQTPVLKMQWEGDELMLAVPPAAPRPGL